MVKMSEGDIVEIWRPCDGFFYLVFENCPADNCGTVGLLLALSHGEVVYRVHIYCPVSTDFIQMFAQFLKFDFIA